MSNPELHCLAELEVVDLKYHNEVGFECQLEYGHKGPHQAKGTSNFYPDRNETECHDGDYTISWEGGISWKEEQFRKQEREKT